MKTLRILLFLLIPLSSCGQSQDSTLQQLNILLSQNIATTREIKFHLDKFSKEHSTGTVLSITGAALMGIALIANSADKEVNQETGQDDYLDILAWAGGITCTAGIIIQIDSFKHIKRAGRSGK